MTAKVANGDRFVMGPTPATFFTWGITEALQDCGDGHIFPNGGDGIIHLVILDFANHTRHFRVDRTKALTRGFTVADVLTEKQFQGGFAAFTDFLALRVNFHALSHRRAAGGMNLTGGLVLYLANHTGGEIVIPLLVAHHGDIDADLLSRMINCHRLVEFQFVIVDR